jgi:hypothetical protein
MICLFGVASALHTAYLDRQNLETVSVIASVKKVLIDNVHRGVLPRLLLHVRDDQMLLAADQAYLLSHSNEWLNDLSNESVYISSSYGNSEDRQEKIRRLLHTEYEVVTEAWWFGEIYLLSDKRSEQTGG